MRNYLAMPLCFINDHFEPFAGAKVHVSDLALHRGYGVFDYCREIGGKVPFLEDYLDRFYRSAEGLRLQVPYEREQVRQKIYYLLNGNGYKESGIKLLLTGGETEDFYQPGKPNFMIFNMPYHAPDTSFDAGVRLMLFEYQRFLPEFKSINYLPGVWLQPMLKKMGAVEPLFHWKGRLTETARANIFLLKKGVVVTPARDILMGVTRKHVLAVAREDYEVEERDVSVEELFEAEEVFMTGTSKHILPVIEVDGRRIGEGVPGNGTDKMRRRFAGYLDHHMEVQR